MQFRPRYYYPLIAQDALKAQKMAFISGPRQVGKTTLGKQFLQDSKNYFSLDQVSFSKIWAKHPENFLKMIGSGPILLDEIHKDKKWKTKLKGIYDTYFNRISFIITGSAKLDIYRKGSDSLLGRYIPYRLHPFSVAEGNKPVLPKNILKRFKVCYPWKDLLSLGGYPEPLLSGSEKKALRWSRLRLNAVAYEDVREIKMISDLHAFKNLLLFLPERVGSLLSFHSLKEDVSVAYATVRDWVLLSEQLYYGFFVRPYSKNIKRSIKAMPKFYLYDILQIENISKRIENLVALHLIKACHFWTDIGEGTFELFFVSDKDKREVDFLVTKNKSPWMLIECKTGSKNISKTLLYYAHRLGTALNIQLVEDKKYDRFHSLSGVRVLGYEKFFASLV